MADNAEIKKCLDELGFLLQEITTMEEKEYEVLLHLTPKMQSYAETVRDLADVASVQWLDQLYRLLGIEP